MAPSPHPPAPALPASAQPPPAGPDTPAEYRIEDLAHRSGATVRTIRAYQDKGLLPKPERRGRANVYGEAHLARLRQIADLLERGYTLASIKELLQAWDEGRGLGGVLGLVAEVDGPWTSEESGHITRTELAELFGGGQEEPAVAASAVDEAAVAASAVDEAAVEEAVALGVLEPLPGGEEGFRVPSPRELAVAAELHKAGVPLPAITGQLRELRGQVEHIAARFLDFTEEHVFVRYAGVRLCEADASEAAALVRRLRPLAQQTMEAELARAMQKLAARNLRAHLRSAAAGASAGASAAEREEGAGTVMAAEEPVPLSPAPSPQGSSPRGSPLLGAPQGGAAAPPTEPVSLPAEAVSLPAAAVAAVRELVGEARVPEFIAAAAEREVRARRMDAMAAEAQ
ncbi:MerR family transcriptional regulator [Streptomyces tubbatahanensis]|uniref:MerR family transcriptional regulator n=1 Tax=Streptomyces tubbatahanensis TaxID=2923272 RepID=A0ABY3XTR2_9ACTN|nr:MerR family transcriptional regulator [Streptomyces tubbatahanensis]UNS97842.1 MerR family transcriptional regulator [Streptomyces tubbatahanensis]